METEHALTKLIAKVSGINLAILLLYSAALFFLGGNGVEKKLTFMVSMMVTVALHSAACFISSIIFFIIKRTNFGLAFLLATLLVGLIGFSLCLGGGMGYLG
jgi:hypothetical protein